MLLPLPPEHPDALTALARLHLACLVCRAPLLLATLVVKTSPHRPRLVVSHSHVLTALFNCSAPERELSVSNHWQISRADSKCRRQAEFPQRERNTLYLFQSQAAFVMTLKINNQHTVQIKFVHFFFINK
jgi:hypothetical protein